MNKLAVLLCFAGSFIQLTYCSGKIDVFPRGPDKKGVPEKIYQYNEAPKDAYPFTVYLAGDSYSPYCTGSIIGREWVLTAAHCLDIGAKYIIAADYDRENEDGTEQIIEIDQEILHPEYDSFGLDNDIGLIKVKSRFNTREPGAGLIVPLASKGFFNKMMENKKKCRVAGWGNTYYEPGGWQLTQKLLFQDVRFANTTEAEYRGYFMPESHFAMEVAYRRCQIGGICFGDSGGPTFCRTKGGWVQTGITSFLYTVDGCVNGLKGITNVQMFTSWIEDTMANN